MKTQNAISTLTRFMGALLIVMLLLAGPTARPAAAFAGTNRYVATSGTDSGNCTNSSHPCKTITYAISQADSNDEIYISAGTYAENLSPDKNVYFFGAGRDATLLDGGGLAKVVHDLSYDLSFTDLTIQNGHATDCGGGIEQRGGTLTLLRVKVTNNVALCGGGILSDGSLTITDSVVSDNHANIDASGVGGGLALADATVSLSGVTISGNIATDYGGGIHDQGSGTLNLTNVTISGNTAKTGGAMTSGGGTVHILNSTIADNHLPGGGGIGSVIGGISDWGTISFKNTIIAGNDRSNCGIGGGSTWTSQGYNLDSGHTCNFTETGDLQNTDPQLGPLADNGGPTPTHALLRANGVHPISPAIDGGPVADCPGIDQRGAERPFETACDIGAYEYVERTISGNAGVGSAVLSYHDDTDKTSSADGGGIYSFAVPYGWSGTVTPSRAGYLFTPVNRTYSHVLADQTGQNFTARVANFYVATTGSDASNDCQTESNPCMTVPYAALHATSDGIIHIAAGTYAAHLVVDKNLTFMGAGMNQTILDGGGTGRVLFTNYDMSIFDLTIQNGYTTGDGAGIRNDLATMNLTRVKVTNNRASNGGGIISNGPLNLTDCVISGNQATGVGGGLFLHQTGTTSLTNVTVSGNTSTVYGGGLHQQDGGTLNLTNVTISGNTAGSDGGGAISAGGSAVLNILNSTIAGNHYGGSVSAGGIYAYDATTNIKNTIVSGNDADNCFFGGTGTHASGGYNLDSGHTCNFTGTGDLQNTNPQLGPLADNGGPTQTHALLRANGTHPISPAIDGGPISDCPGTDQRGAERPFGSACDIGAYEYVERTISGNAGVGSAVLSYHDDTNKTSAADGGGNYSFAVPYGWSGTVTPSKVGLLFTPVKRTYTHVLVDQTGQNFAALVTISGNAGASGATLAYIVGGDPKTVISNAKGNYSFTVPYGWSGMVTPSIQCSTVRNSLKRCTFTPVRRSYTNIKVNQSGQNYTFKMVY